jgi:AraC-like DNA-binding protein
MVPAGLLHELRLDGEPVMVLYAEPDFGGAGALARFVADAEERDGALLGRSLTKTVARELYEHADSSTFLGAALDDLLGFGQARTLRAMDIRIAKVAKRLTSAEHVIPVAGLSREVGLSPSRLEHLFKQEVGVPLGRYRTWLRMRRAINEIVAGANFTAAAHAAGFADQAHFAHDFRATFGAPASVSLTNPRGGHPATCR